MAGGACVVRGGGMHDRGRAWQEKRQLQWTVRILLECILACGSFCIVTVFINLKGRIKGKISWSKEFYFSDSSGVFIVSKMANNPLNLNTIGIWPKCTSLFFSGKAMTINVCAFYASKKADMIADQRLSS